MATQLLVAVNGICLLLIGAFLVVDYEREISRRVQERDTTLTEQAVFVHAAIRGLQHHGVEAIQQYIDTVCHHVPAPHVAAHHIAVRIGDDSLQAQPHGRASPEMLAALERAADQSDRQGEFRGRDLVVGTVKDGNLRVYVSEFVEDIRHSVRGQVWTRLGRLMLLAAVAAVVVNVVLLRLFVRPLDRMIAGVGRIGAGDFGVHVDGATNRELAQLSHAVNEMSDALADAERHRKVQIDKARRLQRHLLPDRLSFPGWVAAALYEPAEQVAGDFYDVAQLRDGSRLLFVADVSGHGIPAAMAASILKSLFSTSAEQAESAIDVMRFVNRHFCSATVAETFASAVIVQFLPNGREILSVNAGHPPPMLLQRCGTMDELKSTGLLLGFDAEAGWEPQAFPIQPGDRILVFTDGVIETFSESRECFGRERLRALLRNRANLDVEPLLDTIRVTLATFRGERPADDDVTAVVLEAVSVVTTPGDEDYGGC